MLNRLFSRTTNQQYPSSRKKCAHVCEGVGRGAVLDGQLLQKQSDTRLGGSSPKQAG